MKITPITSLSEITLEKGVAIMNVNPPAKFVEYQRGAKVDFTTEEKNRDIPKFYGDILSVLYDIPADIMSDMSVTERTLLWNEYAYNLWFDIYFGNYSHCGKISQFDHRGKTYKLPKIEIINGTEVVGRHLRVYNFTESSDLLIASDNLKSGNYHHAATIIAIILSDEKYNEDKLIEMSKEFYDLPMDLVHEVFFSLIVYNNVLQMLDQVYTASQQISEIKQQIKELVKDGKMQFTELRKSESLEAENQTQSNQH
jgi:hypothetical protein